MDITVEQYAVDNLHVTTVEGKQTIRDTLKYISVPAFLLDTPLSRNAMLLYGLLNSFEINNKTNFSSDAKLAEALRLSERSIQKLLRELENNGLLVITYRDKKKRNRHKMFVVNPKYELEQQERYAEQRVAIRRTTRRDTQDSVHTNKDTNNETNKKNIIKKETEEILEAYNTAWKTTARSTRAWENNYKKWREDYNFEEIKAAVERMKFHPWIGGLPSSFSLESFFRTDKDWIGACKDLIKPKEKLTLDERLARWRDQP